MRGVKRIILTNQRFGKLVASTYYWHKTKYAYWKCVCDCGTKVDVYEYHLTHGRTKQCKKCQNRALETHGKSKSRTYNVWKGMLGRCKYRHLKCYKNYGGRGIKVCRRWSKFVNFLEDMGEVPGGLELDRIDNSKGYYKENCRWTTRKVNCNNFRRNKRLVFENENLTIAEWAEKLKVPYDNAHYHLSTRNKSILEYKNFLKEKLCLG